MFTLRFQHLGGAILLGIVLGTASVAVGQSVLDLPAPVADTALDVTQNTPRGRVRPGGDITAALQWALDNLHLHKRHVTIPAGEWKLTKTIRTPYRSGLTLIGVGAGIGDHANQFAASRTLLKWAGKPGETMIEFCGSDATIGHFTLVGTGSELGIVVANPGTGLGVGGVRFAPIQGRNLDTLIQCGTERGTPNCDNLHFEWLVALKCGRVYRGMNLQGIDIVIERLATMNTPIGIEMHGGGSLWVQYSTAIHPCTLLKINNTGGLGVGKYNGWFRLSNTKVDSQANDGFCLVDCEEPYPIRILADGGLYSNDQAKGTFAKLSGRNHLEIRDWTATFQTIEGVADNGQRPTVMLRGSRLWKPVDEIFTGSINARVRDCVSTSGEWIDWDSTPQQK